MAGAVLTDGVRPLRAAYGALTDVVAGLGDDDRWTETGCPGWAVRDLVFHLRADCLRALVALHTPVAGPADCDAVAYWRQWGSDADTDEEILRGTRVEASPYPWGALRRLYGEAATAAVHAVGGADPAAVVGTQGWALTVDDLASTLAVEATLHHVDLVRHLPGAAGPSPKGFAEVRRVTEALLERELPGWPDERVALVATGRAVPTDQERTDLGDAVVPVFT
jgi:hypothetical protein